MVLPDYQEIYKNLINPFLILISLSFYRDTIEELDNIHARSRTGKMLDLSPVHKLDCGQLSVNSLPVTISIDRLNGGLIMSESILILNAIIAVSFVLVALFAGHVAGSLAYCKTIASLRHSAKINGSLLALIGLLGMAKLAVLAYVDSYNMLAAWENLLLFVLLIALPAIAIVIFSVPRLFEIIHLQANDAYEPANRTKRRCASEVALVVPIQVLTIGSLLYAYQSLYSLPISFRIELVIVVFFILLTAASLAWRQRIKRRHIHRDDGTSVFHWLKRVSVYATAGIVVTVSAMHTVSYVKSNNQTTSSNEKRSSVNVQHISVKFNRPLDQGWIKLDH